MSQATAVPIHKTGWYPTLPQDIIIRSLASLSLSPRPFVDFRRFRPVKNCDLPNYFRHAVICFRFTFYLLPVTSFSVICTLALIGWKQTLSPSLSLSCLNGNNGTTLLCDVCSFRFCFFFFFLFWPHKHAFVDVVLPCLTMLMHLIIHVHYIIVRRPASRRAKQSKMSASRSLPKTIRLPLSSHFSYIISFSVILAFYTAHAHVLSYHIHQFFFFKST